MPLILPGKAKSKLLPYRANVTWISIDPGLGGTGWCVWRDTGDKEADKLACPITSGSIVSHARSHDWWVHVDSIATSLVYLCREHYVSRMYMELPTFMEGGVGMTAARRGDLVKLVTMFGAILGRCAQYAPQPFSHEGYQCPLTPVDIIKWKGNAPKELTCKRMDELALKIGYDFRTDTTHERDAFGIGMYVKGVY